MLSFESFICSGFEITPSKNIFSWETGFLTFIFAPRESKIELFIFTVISASPWRDEYKSLYAIESNWAPYFVILPESVIFGLVE